MKRRLYVPIMNSTLTSDTRAEYLSMIQSLGVCRVFISVDRNAFFLRGADKADLLRSLCANVEYFKNEGLEVGLWTQAFGFGDPLTDAQSKIAKDYTSLRSVSGKTLDGRDAFCPESDPFAEDYVSFIEYIATSRPNMIMLDDDLCLSVRPGIGCFCKKHLSLIEKELGVSLPADSDLTHLFFCGEENEYRHAWKRVMGKTHADFAARIREAVDRIDTKIGVGFCAGYTSFDIEGFDVYELAKIYAGNNRPFVRLTGAPYWASKARNRFENQPLGAVIECARSQYAVLKNRDIDVFSEADPYPRPAYMVPASLIECFSTALCAEEGLSELFYPFDYYSSPSYETRYVTSRVANKALYEFIEKNFYGKSFCGVGVADELNKIAKREIPEGRAERQIMRGFFNRGAELMATSGIPTVYGKADTVIAVGEDARYIDLENMPKRLITDAKGAFILSKRGYDAGFAAAKETAAPSFEIFGKERVMLWSSGESGFYEFELKEGAKINSSFERGEASFPAEYTYRNGGCELLVYTFKIDTVPHISALLLSYERRKSLANFCRPTAFMESVSGIYQICKKGDNGEYAALFVNISEDYIRDGRIRLEAPMYIKEAIGAELELEGDRVINVRTAIPPYGAFAMALGEK